MFCIASSAAIVALDGIKTLCNISMWAGISYLPWNGQIKIKLCFCFMTSMCWITSLIYIWKSSTHIFSPMLFPWPTSKKQHNNAKGRIMVCLSNKVNQDYRWMIYIIYIVKCLGLGQKYSRVKFSRPDKHPQKFSL